MTMEVNDLSPFRFPDSHSEIVICIRLARYLENGLIFVKKNLEQNQNMFCKWAVSKNLLCRCSDEKMKN